VGGARAAAGSARTVVLASLVLLMACAASAEELQVGGASLQLDFERSVFGSAAPQILEWVRRSADIVSRYYGRFPTTRVTVRLAPMDGAGVRGGKTFANPHAAIRVQLGREVTTQQLLADWVLVHEMTHLALPDTGEAHAWLSEGLATYV